MEWAIGITAGVQAIAAVLIVVLTLKLVNTTKEYTKLMARSVEVMAVQAESTVRPGVDFHTSLPQGNVPVGVGIRVTRHDAVIKDFYIKVREATTQAEFVVKKHTPDFTAIANKITTVGQSPMPFNNPTGQHSYDFKVLGYVLFDDEYQAFHYRYERDEQGNHFTRLE